MSETATLRRYTEEEDNLILHYWHDKNRRPELAEKLERPLGGLAYRFYQLLKERDLAPKEYRRLMRQGKVGEVLTTTPTSVAEPPLKKRSSEPDDLLEALKYFPNRAQALEEELAQIKQDLAQLKQERQTTGPQFFNEENQRLQAMVEELQGQLDSERQRLEKERQELREVYDDLEAVFSEFMRLSSVDKIRVLGDFASRLEVTVDKFGNVVNLGRSL